MIGEGSDTVDGGAGNDFLNIFGSGLDDSLTVVASGGLLTSVEGGTVTNVENVTANALGGIDLLSYGATTQDITVNLATAAATGFDNSIVGFENVTGGLGNDALTGDAQANVLDGAGGDDTINGGDQNDILFGRAGNDIINGGADSDTVTYSIGEGSDTVDGGAGNDILEIFGSNETLTVVASGGILTSVEGGTVTNVENVLASISGGADLLSYGATTQDITVNLATQEATGFVGISGFENATGGSGDDTLTGGAGANVLNGAGGDDTINGGDENDIVDGGGGIDTLNGEAGFDTLNGGAGNDIINGGLENDLVTYVIGEGSDTVDGGAGNDNLEIFAFALNKSLNVVASGGILTSIEGGTVTNVENVIASFLSGGANLLTYGATTQDITVNLLTQAATGFVGMSGFDNATGGSGDDTLTGGAGTNVLNGGAGIDTMSGGADNDSYFVDAAGDVVNETAGQGSDRVIAVASYALAAGASIELLQTEGSTSTAVINLTGNELAQTLQGNAAANTLDGGGGADTMQGFAGNDTYFVDNAGDNIIDTAGIDNVNASVSYTLAAGVAVETLRTTNATGTTAINLTGSNLSNTVIGNAGNNILDGASNADTLQGLGGNDTYFVDNAGDNIIDTAGIDNVKASVTYMLAAGVSVETLQTTSAAGTTAINLTGNNLANTVIGNAGNNILNGAAGIDLLQGGLGDDIYVVDNVADKAIEAAGAGTDRIDSAVTFTLGANVENLTLTGAAAINGTGNTFANIIIGNGANNVLNGLAGADSMSGFGGNDTYVVDNASDKTIESAGGGIDLVNSAVSLTLAVNVDNLTLIGTAASGTGNALNNTIKGNNAVNTLNGLAGSDMMQGLGGNDTYVVDRTTDRVIEAASGGIDLVKSSATYTLAVNVDNLTLTGAGPIRGTGNATANTINGNNAANVLAGMTGNDTLNAGGGNDLLIGGLGKDLMIGGLGNDRFDFNIVAEIGKGITRDVIVGFTHLTDKIDLGTIDANGAAGGHTFTFLTAIDAAFHRRRRAVTLVPRRSARHCQRQDHHRRRHQRQQGPRFPDSARWPQIAHRGRFRAVEIGNRLPSVNRLVTSAVGP